MVIFLMINVQVKKLMSIYGELSAEGGRDGVKVVIIVTASRNLRSENCKTVHANQWSCVNQKAQAAWGYFIEDLKDNRWSWC